MRMSDHPKPRRPRAAWIAQREHDQDREVAAGDAVGEQEADVVAESEEGQLDGEQVVDVVRDVREHEVDEEEERHALQHGDEPRLVPVQEPAHEVVRPAQQAIHAASRPVGGIGAHLRSGLLLTGLGQEERDEGGQLALVELALRMRRHAGRPCRRCSCPPSRGSTSPGRGADPPRSRPSSRPLRTASGSPRTR